MQIKKMTRTQEDEFQKMRALAVENAPYLIDILYSVQPVAAPGLDTLAVDDRWRVFIDFDCDFVSNLTIQQKAWALIHECFHVIRDHHGRSAKSMTRADLIAADCEINDDIITVGQLSIISSALLPDTFGMPRGKTMEEYRDLLNKKSKSNYVKNLIEQMRDADTDIISADNGRNSAGGDQSNGRDGDKSSNRSNDQNGDQYGDQSGNQPNDQSGAQSGAQSGTQADDQGNKNSENKRTICPGVIDAEQIDRHREYAEGIPEGRDDFERDMTMEQAARRILDHEKAYGRVPGSLLRDAEIILAPPKVDWSQHLYNISSIHLTEIIKGRGYSTWRKRNKRITNFYMPGHVDYAARVGVIIDTSASMDNELLSQMVSETMALAALPNVTIDVMSADTTGYEIDYGVNTGYTVELSGGGGTHMGKAIDDMAEKSIHPYDMMIVLTDGYTPWDMQFTGPVIAGIINDYGVSTEYEPPENVITVNIEL